MSSQAGRNTGRPGYVSNGPWRPHHCFQRSLRRPARPHPALHQKKSLPQVRPAQSYLKECENGRALRGGSRRRRNVALGKGGHAGTPMTTPTPHTTGRVGHAPRLHSPQGPTL